MPPCKKVLKKKIDRVKYFAKMIKFCNRNFVDRAENGWILNECKEMEIDYFSGGPYPENITNISISTQEDEDSDDDDENGSLSNESEDEDWA